VPGPSRSGSSFASGAPLAALLVILPLARGGVGISARLGAVVLATLSLVLLARRRLGLPWHAIPLGGVVGIVALQLLPVPAALHPLSPGARSLFEAVLAPLGLYPATRPLSLDPPETALELADCAAGLAAFVAAWTLGATRRGRELILSAIPTSGVIVAAVIIGRALAGAGTLLAPTFPFVNPNHLAGFMCLTSLAALGLAMRERGQARLLWLVAFMACASMVLFSLSRGGIAALLAGLGVFVALTFRRSREAVALPGWSRLALASGLSVVIALGAWVALRPLLRELESLRPLGEEDKTSLWSLAISMVRDFPALGVGRTQRARLAQRPARGAVHVQVVGEHEPRARPRGGVGHRAVEPLEAAEPAYGGRARGAGSGQVVQCGRQRRGDRQRGRARHPTGARQPQSAVDLCLRRVADDGQHLAW